MEKIILTSEVGPLTEGRFLFHGNYNTGKSYLCASALKNIGQPTLYVMIGDEPVLDTLRAVGATETEIVRITSYDDVMELMKQTKLGSYNALAIDSLPMLVDIAMNKITDGTRTPGTGRGNDGRAEWGQIKYFFYRALSELFKLAPFTFAVSASDKKENELNGQTEVIPALIGDLSQRIGGRFPYVGYIDLTTMSATQVQRRLHFEPMIGTLTRCNVKQPFTKPLPLENGPSVWCNILKSIEERR